MLFAYLETKQSRTLLQQLLFTFTAKLPQTMSAPIPSQPRSTLSHFRLASAPPLPSLLSQVTQGFLSVKGRVPLQTPAGKTSGSALFSLAPLLDSTGHVSVDGACRARQDARRASSRRAAGRPHPAGVWGPWQSQTIAQWEESSAWREPRGGSSSVRERGSREEVEPH